MRFHHRLCVPTVVLLLGVAALAAPARGQDIGVSYSGVGVDDGLPAPWDLVATTASWSVDFCFDPTVVDTDPSADVGVYPGAITSAIVTIGGIAVAADLGGENQVRVANDQGPIFLLADSVGFTFELTNGMVVTVGFTALGSPPTVIADDGLPDCPTLSNFNPAVVSLNVPGPEPLTFLLFDGDGLECGACEAPECYLVLGDVPGAAGTFTVFGHTYSTQVGTAGSWWPVWLDEGPELVIWDPPAPMRAATIGLSSAGLPSAGPSTAGLTSVDLSAVAPWTFCAQVVMWNPAVFPANPEQSSHGLAVTVLPDGRVFTAPYGPSDGGLALWAETDWNAQGQKVLRLPFSIPGF